MKHNKIRFISVLAIFGLAFIALIAASPASALAANRNEPMQSGVIFNSYGCSYFVRSGDTLFSIALRYNTNLYALAAVNGLSNPNFIYAGMVLSVPCQNTPPPSGNPPPSTGICNYHIVRPGEYLALIAAKYNTTWQTLAQFNRLSNPNWVYAGMRLAIPCTRTPPGGSGQWKTFTSTRYNYSVNYPADWTVRVNTSVPSSAGANPEFVKLALNDSALPQVEINAMTGTPPFTGYENCVRNFVFRNLPTCKISVPGGQMPQTDIWVFQKGNAHFRIALVYKDAGSAQLFDDVMRSFQFTP